MYFCPSSELRVGQHMNGIYPIYTSSLLLELPACLSKHLPSFHPPTLWGKTEKIFTKNNAQQTDCLAQFNFEGSKNMALEPGWKCGINVLPSEPWSDPIHEPLFACFHVSFRQSRGAARMMGKSVERDSRRRIVCTYGTAVKVVSLEPARMPVARFGHRSMAGNCHLRLNRPGSLPVAPNCTSLMPQGRQGFLVFSTGLRNSERQCLTRGGEQPRHFEWDLSKNDVKFSLASKWSCLAPANSERREAAERSQQQMPHEQAPGPKASLFQRSSITWGKTLQFSQIRAIFPN